MTLDIPFVTYKVALTLDGRVTVARLAVGSGQGIRTLVHVLRAQSDAVAVGIGTVRWDDPRLDARASRRAAAAADRLRAQGRL